MLASHSKIDFLPETGFIRRYWISKKISRSMRAGNIKKLISVINEDKRLSRLSVDLQTELTSLALTCNHKRIELALYERICSHELRTERNFIGDKDPKLIEYQPFISRKLKNASIIHIIRDPRDVLLSKKKAIWSKHRHVWLHTLAWRVQQELSVKYVTDTNLHYFELKYEDLISSPEKNLQALCKFLGLCYEPNMLSFSENNRQLVAPEEFDWKKEVLEPLNQTNMNKWKNGLANREIILIEMFCNHLMYKNGYKKGGNFSSLFVKDKIWVLKGYLVMSCLLLAYKFLRSLERK